MSVEDKLGKQMEEYSNLAKDNKNVNVGALMINALEQAQREEMDAKKRGHAYLVSVILPPSGLFIAAYYYFFSGKPDAKDVARNCLILTGIVVVITLLIGKMFLDSIPANTGATLQNVNINDLPNQYKDLLK